MSHICLLLNFHGFDGRPLVIQRESLLILLSYAQVTSSWMQVAGQFSLNSSHSTACELNFASFFWL